jgi:predicted nuclease with RNAse H fold
MAIFKKEGNVLVLQNLTINNSDRKIIETIGALSSCGEEVIVGLDAPLSYQDGGGDRPSDKEIRNAIRAAGFYHGSIMPPTFHRMVYLTLRGIGLSRSLQKLNASIVEVHPGAALGLRLKEEDRNLALTYKKNNESRLHLIPYFDQWGVKGITAEAIDTSHGLDACAAALAAWHWGDPDYMPKLNVPASPLIIHSIFAADLKPR